VLPQSLFERLTGFAGAPGKGSEKPAGTAAEGDQVKPSIGGWTQHSIMALEAFDSGPEMCRGERGRISADRHHGGGLFEPSNHNSLNAFPQIAFALEPCVRVPDRNRKCAWPRGCENRTDAGVRLYGGPYILEHRGC
jgi:hypothetical protein